MALGRIAVDVLTQDSIDATCDPASVSELEEPPEQRFNFCTPADLRVCSFYKLS